jgi:uncharacterized C2H2 Zn-finger protein
MALKCVTCGLLFRNRNELDWHIREEHLQQRLPPIKNSRRRPRLRPRTRGKRHVSATTIRPKHRHPPESRASDREELSALCGSGACGYGTAHLYDQHRPTPTEVWPR